MRRRRRVDGLGGLIHWFSFFCFVYLINRGGQPTTSVKAGLTVTFCRRQMGCSPQLTIFSHLG
jgi:hypothetical protein